MKSSTRARIASARLHFAISALPKLSSVGIVVAACALGSADVIAQTTINAGQNTLSNSSSSALGALTRNAGGTLLVTGNGTGTLSASGTLTNGLLPWAFIQSSGAAANNSANGYTFATISGGNLVPYTAATSQTLTTAWGGIGSGGTGTVNHDVSASAALLGATGLNRNVNTIRYTGTGARQPGNNAGDLLTINGLMNAGTGALTLGRNGSNITNDFSFGILVGTSRELVLAPMTSDLVLYSFIKDGTGTPTAGAVTVAGSGSNKAELAGVNTYTGATTVNGGTLLVSGAGSINATSGVTVNGTGAKYVHTSSVASTRTITLTKGTVDGSGTLGTVNVGNATGGILANGNGGTGTLTVGTLSFAGAATISGNYVIGSKPFNVTGTLSTTPASGQVTVNLSASGGWTTGLNNIIGFGTFSGAASDFTLGTVSGTNSRQSVGGLSLNGSNLALQINGDNPKWTGAQSGVWTTATIGGASNWKLVTAGTDTDFISADNVVFDDSATGVTTVDIANANVAPVTTEFNHSTKDYTLSSSGGFGISNGSLTKSGSGALTISSANTYAGGTTINAGTVNVNNASALGSGTITINGGTLDNTSGAAITAASNAVQTWAGDFVFTGANDLNLGNGNVTLTGGDRTVTVSGGTLTVGKITSAVGGLTKNGSGTLTLNPSGVSSLSGALAVNAGTLNIGAQDLTATGLSGSGTIGNGSATTRWLLVTNASDNSFAGVMQDGGAGKLGFSKSGAGATTLSGVNTLTDTVTVSDGILRFSGSGSIANAGLYVIGNNGVLQVSSNGQLGAAPIQITSGGAGIGTANRLDISGGATVSGAITLAPRNEAALGSGVANDAIRNVGGDNTLSGAITIVTGGSQSRIQSDAGSLTLSGNISTTATAARNFYLQGASNGTVSGVIADNAANSAGKINVFKEGAGAWTISGANTYTGTTTVSNGTLVIGSTGTINNSSSVTIASGAGFKYNSSTPFTGTLINNGGTISGSGALNVNLGLDSLSDRLAPGNSPGVQTLGANQTWSSFTYDWETNDFTGTVAGTAFDQLAITGSLNLTGSTGAYVLKVLSLDAGNATGLVTNFGEVSRSWTIASTTAGITGFDAANWTIDATGFLNSEVGSFALSQLGNDLVLSYSAVPEPATYAALAGLGMLGFAGYRRRRNAKASAA